jgi:branched-subunit amino acid transport protein
MASLGMTGLVSFLMATRRHGFFLRKLTGFPDFHIIRSLFRGYLGFVAAGVVLALPVSQILLNIWLETFSVHYYSDYLCFIVPAVLLTGISFGIVCYGVERLRKQMSLHQF